MITQTVTVTEKNAPNIIIGRRGTYNTEEIVFDLTYLVETFGSGSAVMMVKRPMDNTAYPAVTEQDGNTLTWTVSDIDTNFKGHGECELFWYVDDGLAKSLIWPLTILRDIGTTTEEPPEPYPTWIDSLTALGAETLQNAQDAAQSASEAEQSATDAGAAKNAAEIAADRAEDALEEFTTPTASATTLSPDSAATASYSNGHFTFGIPKGDKGDPGDPATNLVTSVNGKTGAVVLNATDVGAYVKPSGGIPKSDLASSVQTSLGKADTALQSAPVISVNNKTGAVVLSASDVGAKPASYEAPVSSVNEKTGAVVLDSEDIRYDSTETYSDGTVGKELGTINSALSSIASVTEIIDTASGAIASFPDGSGLPMRSLVAEINPVQDLHGQSSPYPAGGGKNKLDYDTAYAQFKVGENNFQGNSQTIAGVFIYIPESLVGQALTFSAYVDLTGLELPTAYLVQANVSGSNINGNVIAHGNTGYTEVTFTPTSTSDYVKFTWGSGDNTIKIKDIQLEIGSSRTTWTPYSNICPISGWTGVQGQRTGFNVWDETWEIGNIDPSTGQNTASALRLRSAGYIPVKPSTSYFMCVDVTQAITWLMLCFYDSNKSFIGTYSPNKNNAFTTPANAAFMRFMLPDSWLGEEYKGGISVNYPSTDTSYHAYTGESISVSWQDTAGTVYGGTATYNGDGTWTLVADKAMLTKNTATMNNSESYPGWINSGVKALVGADLAIAFTSKLNIGTEFSVNTRSSNDTLYLSIITYGKTQSEWIALAMDVQILVPLVTPQTYTITTGELIETLVGQNNIWVDVGAVSVEYPADTKLYIDKKIAEALA